jgi:hypothetical protein
MPAARSRLTRQFAIYRQNADSNLYPLEYQRLIPINLAMGGPLTVFHWISGEGSIRLIARGGEPYHKLLWSHMNLQLVELSIVVLANDHNPTILNPDFLALQGIVPREWGWKLAGPPITTPPFATVTYDSGVTVSVETNKLQVVDRSTKVSLSTTKILLITQKYINVLPHVRYTAAGVNFRSFVELEEPDTYIKDHFLKQGPWDNGTHELQAVGLSFTYPLHGGKIGLSLEAGGIINRTAEEEKHRSGIVVSANLHRECTGYPSNQQVSSHLDSLNQDWNTYNTLIDDILKTNAPT